MKAKKIILFGEASVPGVWLYVAKVSRFAEFFIYVGKTGRREGTEPTSPLSRLLGHLSKEDFFNCLQNHVLKKEWPVEECHFELWSYGPLEQSETCKGMPADEHQSLAMRAESALAKIIQAAGYSVVGSHADSSTEDDEEDALSNLLSEIIPDLNSRIRIIADSEDDSPEDDSPEDDSPATPK